MAGLAGQWIVFLVLWFLFTWTLSLKEAAAGAAAAVVGVVALQTALRAVPLCFRPEARWMALGLRVPRIIAADLVTVTRDLLRRVAGGGSRSVWEQDRFAAGEDCSGAAQRALAILYVTSSPNTILLHIDSGNSSMLLHNLTPAPLPPLVRKLQA
jgi:hypothetical protein